MADAGHFLQEDSGAELADVVAQFAEHAARPDYEAGAEPSEPGGPAPERQRVGLGRSAGAQLRLEGRQLVVDLRVLADLVELLLDVVGAATDVLEHAGLEQLVERARAGLHGGDLVLGPLQGGARVVEGLRDPGGALVDRRDGLGRGVLRP